MIILDQIEKLINEHGSASILRDHLAMFKDQVMLLEKENLSLRQKVIELESEKEVIEAKSRELTKDNKELRSKIKEYEQATNQLPKGPRTKRSDFM